MRRSGAITVGIAAMLTLALAGGLDGDGDGVPDDQDCLPQDGSVWAPPALGVSDLTLERSGDQAALGWSRPADLGCLVGSESYDVFGALTATTFSHPGGYCVELDGSDLAALDDRLIHPGEALYYLVRVENACGAAPVDSDPPPATPRELHYVVATNTDDQGPGSLREAILAAADGDAICVDATGVIDLSNDLILDKNLSIDGRDGASLTLLSGTVVVEQDAYLSRMTLDGGGIPSSSSGVHLPSSSSTATIASTTVTRHGTAVSTHAYSAAYATIRDSLIHDNGLGVSGRARVSYTRVTENTDGLRWWGGRIEGCEISGNTDTGIWSWFGFSTLKTIASSTISGNDTGIFTYYDYALVIESSTIADNMTGLDAYLESFPSIRSTTIAGNELGFRTSYYSGLYLRNSILANDDNCSGSGSVTSSGHNLVNGELCWTLQSTDQVGDPLLGPLQDNGGPTPTLAPLAGSPAIDSGSCPEMTRDQRGFPRPVDDPEVPDVDDACDVGSVETESAGE